MKTVFRFFMDESPSGARLVFWIGKKKNNFNPCFAQWVNYIDKPKMDEAGAGLGRLESSDARPVPAAGLDLQERLDALRDGRTVEHVPERASIAALGAAEFGRRAARFQNVLKTGPPHTKPSVYVRWTNLSSTFAFDQNAVAMIMASPGASMKMSFIIQFAHHAGLTTPWTLIFQGMIDFRKSTDALMKALGKLEGNAGGSFLKREFCSGNSTWPKVASDFISWVDTLVGIIDGDVQ